MGSPSMRIDRELVSEIKLLQAQFKKKGVDLSFSRASKAYKRVNTTGKYIFKVKGRLIEVERI